MKVRAKYFRVRDHKDHSCFHPKGLVVFNSDLGTGKVQIGFSLCHPVDQFSKKTARQMANDKLANTPIEFKLDDASTYFKALKQLPHSLRYTSNWLFANEVKRWLNIYAHNMKE